MGERGAGGGGAGPGREENGTSPVTSRGAGALRRRRAAGRTRSSPLLSAPFRSWGCSAPSPAAAASPRTAGRARPAPHEACSKRGPGQLPGSSPGRPLSPVIAWANKAEIGSAGSPAGIKAPSGARSNRRDGRALPAPPALAVPCCGHCWLCLRRAKRRKTPREECSCPVGAAGFGGADSWRRLPFVVSFIHKVSGSPLSLSLCASWSWLAHGRPSGSPAQTRALRRAKDTREPRIRFRIKLPIHKLTLQAWTSSPAPDPPSWRV